MRVDGRFDHAKERYLYALSDEQSRLARHHAARRPPTGDVVLIDRGFVPDALQRPVLARAQGEIGGRGRPSPASCGSRKPKALFIAGQRAGGQSLVLARPPRHDALRCSPRRPSTSRPSSSRPRKATCRAAGPRAARPGSISPTTICNTPSPGSCSPAPSSSSIVVYVRSAYRRRIP